MAIVQKSDSNNVLREDILIVGQNITLPNTGIALLIASIPTLEQGYKLKLEYGCGIIGALSIIVGDLRASYDRATGGNITKISEHLTDATPITNSDFFGDLPKVYTQANTSSQTIEIYGQAPVGYTLTMIIRNFSVTRSY